MNLKTFSTTFKYSLINDETISQIQIVMSTQHIFLLNLVNKNMCLKRLAKGSVI